MGAAARARLRADLVRRGGVEHRHVDARRRRRLADDDAGAGTPDGGPGPGRDQPADLHVRPAGRRTRRPDRPPPPPARPSGLCRLPRRHLGPDRRRWSDHAWAAPAVHLPPWHHRRARRPGLAGDDTRPRAQAAAGPGDRAERRRHQHRPGHRTSLGRPRHHRTGPRLAVRLQRPELRRRDPGLVALAARDSASLRAARRALLRRDPRRPALRPQQRAVARHPGPLRRLLPVRQRPLGAPAAPGAGSAGRWPRALRRAPDRCRGRRGDRRPAPAAPEGTPRRRPDGGVSARPHWLCPWRPWPSSPWSR